MCLLAGNGGFGDRQPTQPGPFMAAGDERHRDMKEDLLACLLFLVRYVPWSSEILPLPAPLTPLLCPILLPVLFYFSTAPTSPTCLVPWGQSRVMPWSQVGVRFPLHFSLSPLSSAFYT